MWYFQIASFNAIADTTFEARRTGPNGAVSEKRIISEARTRGILI
jgi:hypothetical protein